MTREFKPGAAAVVRCNELSCPDAEHAAIVGKLGDWYILGLGEYLHDVEPVRPLVVIDPEDREQVERLTRIFMDDHDSGDETADMQAALREFTNPTPPRCTATLNIAGERFQCQLNTPHDNLAHSNSDAEAIWGESQ